MLTEAKALGLVEITIHDPWQRSAVFLEKLQKRWQIQDAVLQEDLEDENVNVIVRVQVQAWTAVNVFPIL